MFKNIFKSVGKVFKKIGKGIKKAFKAVGKFTNKLGIVGQIGMMFAAPYLAGWAMTGLTTLGSGFMTGLGTAAKGAGFWGQAASLAQKVFQIAGTVAKSGISAFRTISSTVTGVVGDIAKGIGNSMGLDTNIPVIDKITGKATGEVGTDAGIIFKNITSRFTYGAKATTEEIGNVGKIWKNQMYPEIVEESVSRILPKVTRVNRGPPLNTIKSLGDKTSGGILSNDQISAVSAQGVIPSKILATPPLSADQLISELHVSANKNLYPEKITLENLNDLNLNAAGKALVNQGIVNMPKAAHIKPYDDSSSFFDEFFNKETFTKTATDTIGSLLSTGEKERDEIPDNRRIMPKSRADLIASVTNPRGPGASLGDPSQSNFNAMNSLENITDNSYFRNSTHFINAMNAEYEQPMALGVKPDSTNYSLLA